MDRRTFSKKQQKNTIDTLSKVFTLVFIVAVNVAAVWVGSYIIRTGWLGLEYILDGYCELSNADKFIAVLLSMAIWFSLFSAFVRSFKSVTDKPAAKTEQPK